MVRAFIEGFSLGNGIMNASINPGILPFVADSVIFELHNITFPYSTVFSVDGIIGIDGNGSFSIPTNLLGQLFYINLRHRNSIPIWSATPLAMNAGGNYDFTTAANKAFGSNQASLGNGYFGMWSGDINQDGTIDSNDYSEIENAVQQFIFDYSIFDITGDNQVESNDYSLIENNTQLFIFVAQP